MLWAVAARYNFSEESLWRMPVGRLMFWFRGHERMVRQETAVSSGGA